jgi:hypothetical protein
MLEYKLVKHRGGTSWIIKGPFIKGPNHLWEWKQVAERINHSKWIFETKSGGYDIYWGDTVNLKDEAYQVRNLTKKEQFVILL